MTDLLSSEELRAARLVSEGDREQRQSLSVLARTMAESIERDLYSRNMTDGERWVEAKRIATFRLRSRSPEAWLKWGDNGVDSHGRARVRKSS